MIKKCLCCIGSILLCALSSCGDESVVHLLTGGLYEIRMSGVSVKVFPTSLKCGEEITIEGSSSTNDTHVSVIISSETLDVNDTLTTPFIWNKTLNRVGNHEMTLLVNSALIPFSTSTIISVRK